MDAQERGMRLWFDMSCGKYDEAPPRLHAPVKTDNGQKAPCVGLCCPHNPGRFGFGGAFL